MLRILANVFLALSRPARQRRGAGVRLRRIGGFSHRISQPIYFHVAIRAAELLLRDEDGIVPTTAEVALAERALAWVLRTLALAGDRVGLRRPPFG